MAVTSGGDRHFVMLTGTNSFNVDRTCKEHGLKLAITDNTIHVHDTVVYGNGPNEEPASCVDDCVATDKHGKSVDDSYIDSYERSGYGLG